MPQSTTTSGLQGMAYRYDQLNRIKSANAFRDGTLSATNNVWGATAANNGAYAETFSYDLNGNIMSLTRNGNLSGAQQVMDQFTYTYIRNTAGNVVTNKLGFVDDAAASANYTDDLDDQAAGNYTYDAVGNLVGDVKEEIQVINWNQRGKIKEVKRSTGSQKAELVFGYSADGQRLYKKVKPRTGGNLDQEEKWETSWYVRDGGGNVLAIYKQYDLLTGPNTFQRTLRLEEQTLFGSKRLGVHNANSIIATVNFVNTGGYTADKAYGNVNYTTRNVTAGVGNKIVRKLGNCVYEMSNHLGNVLATVVDRKVGVDGNADGTVDYYSAVVLSATDYSAFGAPLSGRSFSSNAYRYSMNGQEKDEELGAGVTTAEYWEYDAKLARRWNVDPVMKPWESGYACLSNSPVSMVDPLGASAEWHPEDDGTGNMVLVADEGDFDSEGHIDQSILRDYLTNSGVNFTEEEFTNWVSSAQASHDASTTISDVKITPTNFGQFNNLPGKALMKMYNNAPGGCVYSGDPNGGCSPSTFKRSDAATTLVYNGDQLGDLSWSNPNYQAWQGNPELQNNSPYLVVNSTGVIEYLGLGYGVSDYGIKNGMLEPGAVLGLQKGSNGHSVIFTNYIYDATGNIIGLNYWQNNNYCSGYTGTVYFNEKLNGYCDGWQVKTAANWW